MPFSSGTYTLPVNSFNPAVASTTINPTDWNSSADDLETALSTCILKDGTQTTTARIPFANGIQSDSITEYTSAAGVTADGTLLKDGNIVLADATDNTKKVTFAMSGITTATTRTVTWPDASGTATLLGNSATGTGDIVRATSPTLVTPTIGVATATSINGLTITSSTGTLTVTNGKTLSASNTLTLAGTDGTTMTFPVASASIGYINIPQNSQSAAYTTVLADQGKHILHPAADTNARTFTIDSNANVAYPVGTAITFINETANVVTIAITSDTLVWSPAGTTGSRSLAQWGVATAVKKTSTSWIITGTGLT